jgi:hypothetical protein
MKRLILTLLIILSIFVYVSTGLQIEASGDEEEKNKWVLAGRASIIVGVISSVLLGYIVLKK